MKNFKQIGITEKQDEWSISCLHRHNVVMQINQNMFIIPENYSPMKMSVCLSSKLHYSKLMKNTQRRAAT